MTAKRWPTPQDYNEAVQNLHVNMNDAELKAGEIETDPLGLPRPMTGAFCSVYRVKCATRDWAVRCFLREIPDVQWRYEEISQFVMSDSLTYTVGFEFQPKGIMVGGLWYPILKMEWVDGQTLDNYLRSHYSKLDRSFAETFKRMTKDIGAAGIAHGDLQHGNIMVHLGQLFLIDYDGMFVPSMKGSGSNELGHRNYQHPRRKPDHFGAFLDNFSAWVIYTSLRALSVDPSLWDTLGAGEDCLLFRQEDYRMPRSSCAFNVLENHHNEEIRKLAQFVRWCLLRDPTEVPDLDADLSGELELPSLAENAPKSRAEQGAESASQVVIQRSWREGEDANSAFVNRPFVEYELRTKGKREYKVVDTAVKLQMRLVHPPLRVRCDLVERGIPAQAEITARDRMGAEWWLSYSYYDEKREQIKVGGMAVSKAEYESVEVGDKLTVLYVPGTDDRVLYKFAGVKATSPQWTPTRPASAPQRTSPVAPAATQPNPKPSTLQTKPPTVVVGPTPTLVVTPSQPPRSLPAKTSAPTSRAGVPTPQPKPQPKPQPAPPPSPPPLPDPPKYTLITLLDEADLANVAPPRVVSARPELVTIEQYPDAVLPWLALVIFITICAIAVGWNWLLVVTSLAIIAFCAVWYYQSHRVKQVTLIARELATYGKYAAAKITGKTIQTENAWWIRYEYTNDKGEERKGTFGATTAEAATLQLQDEVAVLYNEKSEMLYRFCPYRVIGNYDRDFPAPPIALVSTRRTRISFLAESRLIFLGIVAACCTVYGFNSDQTLATMLMIYSFVAFGLFLIVQGIQIVDAYSEHWQRKVLEKGMLAQGRITKFEQAYKMPNFITFRWKDSNGKEHQSSINTSAVATPGNDVLILYDPATHAAVPYGMTPWELY